MPTSSGRSATDLALRFTRRYTATGPRKTLRELADEYAVTPARMRTILRTARPFLARKGLVTTVPIREDGYVIVLSSEVAEVARRINFRMGPILTELIRYDEDVRVVNSGVSPFDALIEALLDVSDQLGDLSENSVP